MNDNTTIERYDTRVAPSRRGSFSGEALGVTGLALTDFRNYLDMQIDVGGHRVVVLTGHNGAGKTSVLEAVSLLSPGRGLRKAKLREITHRRRDVNGWVVGAQVQGAQGHVHIGTGLDASARTERRVVKIDGGKPRTQQALAEHLSISWQTPQMDGLFQDAQGERRQFLDRLVYNFDPQHVSRINTYDQLMRERMQVLHSDFPDPAWLKALEQKMAAQGLAIAAARLEMVDRLNRTIMLSESGFPKAHLSLEGEVEESLRRGEAAVDVEVAFAQRLERARPVDKAAGRTLKGTHRTIFTVLHLLKNIEAAFCSTGEQKALLLSILLAHARARKEWYGAAPIILLDEVVAHLDEKRRAELFHEIADLGAQTWLTGTDVADFSALPAGGLWLKVENSFISKR